MSKAKQEPREKEKIEAPEESNEDNDLPEEQDDIDRDLE